MKKRFLSRFLKRFFVRFHMSLILAGVVMAGVIANWLLLRVFGLESMALRYGATVLAGYGAFFALIRLWLSYVRVSDRVSGEIPDLGVYTDPGVYPMEGPADELGRLAHFSGGGGSSGGGGATASWEHSAELNSASSSPAVSMSPASVQGSGGTSLSGTGVDIPLDEVGIGLVFLILFAVVATGLACVGGYLVYEAPAILGDAAFDAALASGLARAVRRMDCADWKGSVFKATWAPFLVAFLIAVVSGKVVASFCPGAHSIRDLREFCVKF